MQAAIDAVRAGEVDAALIPIENSVEGSVSITLDELAKGMRLVIVDEVALPVRFTLMARPGTGMAGVGSLASHPHALAQVRTWIAENLPDAVVIPSLSTAGAAAALLHGAATVRCGRGPAAGGRPLRTRGAGRQHRRHRGGDHALRPGAQAGRDPGGHRVPTRRR